MSAPVLEILEPGLLTTVQDQGRYGYQRFGVPVAGAMDVFALRAANLLVGNDENSACLEMTVLGPRIKFLADTWFAVTGGDLSPALDGEALPNWQTVRASEGSVLAFRGPQDGMRAYIAIAGGIDVPVVMGSRSTYTKAAIGGLEGRALKPGDTLDSQHAATEIEFVQRSFPENIGEQVYGVDNIIRVVSGPQREAFTQEGMETFLGSEYSVSMQSDRMGYRMEGPKIEHVSGPDIISDGTAFGSVQIPGDGQPIVLLADRGTTGGYTKIATVISSDIGKLSQTMPGQTVRFQSVTVDEAQAVLRQRESLLDSVRAQVAKRLGVVVDGEAIEITNEDGKPVALAALAGAENEVTRHGTATVEGRTFEFEIKVHQQDS